MNRSLLIVISGFSGAGKGTIVKRLMKEYPIYALSVSVTTRKPRKGERNGVEYFFVSEDQFESMIKKDEFIEFEKYVGHYYGTPKNNIKKMMDSGKDVLLEIDVRGGLNIKKENPDAVLVFVCAPTMREIERRLKERSSESVYDLRERLKQIQREVESIPLYDYVLVNDDLEECVNNLNSIAAAERMKVGNNREFIEKLEEEIRGRET